MLFLFTDYSGQQTRCLLTRHASKGNHLLPLAPGKLGVTAERTDEIRASRRVCVLRRVCIRLNELELYKSKESSSGAIHFIHSSNAFICCCQWG